MWHDDAKAREKVGKDAEREFENEVKCSCGGKFDFIGDRYAGCPDYTCEICGQLVDVKSSPQAEQTGNLAVSVIPWGKYPDELLLVTRIRGTWIGEYKQNISIVSSNNSPTHNSTNTPYKNTSFHLISWKKFKKLQSLGFKVKP